MKGLGLRGLGVLLALSCAVAVVAATSALREGVRRQALPSPAAAELLEVQARQVTGEAGGTLSLPVAALLLRRPPPGVVLAAYIGRASDLQLGERSERVRVWAVSARFFDMFAVHPFDGGSFDSSADHSTDRVAIVSYELWHRVFTAKASLIGRYIRLDSLDYRVVGIAPQGFRYPPQVDVWTNIGPAVAAASGDSRRLTGPTWMVARTTMRLSEPEVAARLSNTVASVYPAMTGTVSGRIVVAPMAVRLLGDSMRRIDTLALASVALVAIAALSVALLMTAQVRTSAREIRVMLGLGAHAWQVADVFVKQSSILAVTALGGGILAAATSSSLIARVFGVVDGAVPVLSWNTILLTAGIAFGATLLPAVAPVTAALRHAASQGLNLRSAEQGETRHGRRVRDGLVALQLSAAGLLVCGALLLGARFLQLWRLRSGFASGEVTLIELTPARTGVDPTQAQSAAEELMDRIRSVLPSAIISYGTGVPFAGGDLSTVGVVGGVNEAQGPMTWITGIEGSYFETLGIERVSGDPAGVGAADDGIDQVAINRSLKRLLFGDGEALGRELVFFGDQRARVAAVVESVAQQSTDAVGEPQLYASMTTAPGIRLKICVRSSLEPDRLLRAIRSAVDVVPPGIRIERIVPLSSLVTEGRVAEEGYTVMLSFVALTGAATVILSLSSFLATILLENRRRHAISLALGATAWVLRRDMLLRYCGIGIAAIGMGALWAFLLYLRSFPAGGPGSREAVAACLWGGVALLAVVAASVVASTTSLARVEIMTPLREQ